MSQKASLPVVIEDPHINEWGVSLGGPNPPEDLYFLCPDETTAWRLHDAIWNTHIDPDTFQPAPQMTEKMRAQIARRKETVATPNDPKLRDSEARHDGCRGRSAGAASVTCVAVLCSAWLGHSGHWDKSRNGLEEVKTAIDRAWNVVAHRDVGVRSISIWLRALEGSPVSVELGSLPRKEKGAITEIGCNGVLHANSPRIGSVILPISAFDSLALLDVNAHADNDSAKVVTGDLVSLPHQIAAGEKPADKRAENAAENNGATDAEIGQNGRYGWWHYGWHFYFGWCLLFALPPLIWFVVENIIQWFEVRSMCRLFREVGAEIQGKREEWPNDLKLSDSGARRAGCRGRSAGAASVTCVAVLCSAWLGVAVMLLWVIESGEHRWFRWYVGNLLLQARNLCLEFRYRCLIACLRCGQAGYDLLILGVRLRMGVIELDRRWMDFYCRNRVACWVWALAISGVMAVADSATKPETNLRREQQAHDDSGKSAAWSGGPRK